MAIKKSSELDFSNKKIAMLLIGRAGIGKTSVALSAPRPLLLDLENGVDRVEACYRSDTSTVDPSLPDDKKYEEFIKDLTTEDLSNYDTIIIDTLGKLVDLLTPVVIKENHANAQKDGKTLSLKGYGAVSAKISEFIKLVKGLNKNVVFISHCTEVQDGETVKVRVNIPGSTKDKIWDDIDLGGYMEFLGKKRVIHFTPSEKFDAKGTHGITGTYDIPTLKSTREGGQTKDNHFLTDLFKVVADDLQSSKQTYDENKVIYDKAMEIAPKIKNCQGVDALNLYVQELKMTKHALTSREELLSLVSSKASELGATYDKEAKCYIKNTD